MPAGTTIATANNYIYYEPATTGTPTQTLASAKHLTPVRLFLIVTMQEAQQLLLQWPQIARQELPLLIRQEL